MQHRNMTLQLALDILSLKQLVEVLSKHPVK